VTGERRGRSLRAMLVVLSLAGAVLAHFTIVDRFSPALGAALSLVPLSFVALWAVRRSPHRAWTAAAVVLAAIALWAGWGMLERQFASLFFLEHAGGNALLAVVFGRTLAAGREPICTRFARIMHPTLPPEVQAYTRSITLAWTIFFAALASLSAALYLGGFLTAWSALATMGSPILVGLMFVVEYAVRLRALPNWERVGLLGGIRAFSRHFAAAPLQTPR
jgi:uncharacterized membrane protein